QYVPDSIHHEGVKRISYGNEHVLASVHEIGLWSVRNVADAGMPQRLSVRCVERRKVAASVSREQYTSGSCKQSTASSSGEGMPPSHLSGFVVDGRQEIARGAKVGNRFSAEAHRPTRIGIRQIDHIEAIVFLYVEQAGFRRVRRRRPIRDSAFNRR